MTQFFSSKRQIIVGCYFIFLKSIVYLILLIYKVLYLMYLYSHIFLYLSYIFSSSYIPLRSWEIFLATKSAAVSKILFACQPVHPFTVFGSLIRNKSQDLSDFRRLSSNIATAMLILHEIVVLWVCKLCFYFGFIFSFQLNRINYFCSFCR